MNWKLYLLNKEIWDQNECSLLVVSTWCNLEETRKLIGHWNCTWHIYPGVCDYQQAERSLTVYASPTQVGGFGGCKAKRERLFICIVMIESGVNHMLRLFKDCWERPQCVHQLEMLLVGQRLINLVTTDYRCCVCWKLFVDASSFSIQHANWTCALCIWFYIAM